MNADRWKMLHLGLMTLWILLAVPSILLWSESILWVIFISLYANVASHFGAYQAAHAEKENEELMNQLKKIIEKEVS
jgi:hypothetical protein